MHHGTEILLTLFAIFVAAQIGAEIAQRLKLPGVVGEIVAGCLVGPSVLGLIHPDQILTGTPLSVLAELGVVFLLFSVGLETRLEELGKVGRSAFLEGEAGTEEVRAMEGEAHRLGIQGVPFFILDRRLAVSGAQAPEVMMEAARKALAMRGEAESGPDA